MKSTIKLIHTAILFFAALASAVPLQTRQSSTAVIVVQTGDGDSAASFSLPLDKLTATMRFASSGVAAGVDQSGVFCQAFSDAAGKTPLGNIFDSTTDAILSTKSNGGITSTLADAVPIGAFLCSNSKAKLTGSKTTTPPSSTTSAAAHVSTSSSSSTTPTIRLELEQSADQFVQDDFPADASIVLTANTSFGNLGLDMSLVAAMGADLSHAHCQAYADVYAMIPVGGPATITTNDKLSYGAPVTIRSVRCVVKGN